jgi:hypothetical protein
LVVKRILAIAGCTLICSARALTFSPNDDAAREAANDWLRVVDSGNYKHATLMMSEEVRGQQDWLGYFNAQRARLGSVNKRQIEEVKHASTIPGLPGVRHYVIVRFKSSFERKPVAGEEVVIMKTGCCWEVVGYGISTTDTNR